MPRTVDITGRRFGRLIALAPAGFNARHLQLWRCACDCGAEPVVVGSDLRRGATTSCGCYRREKRFIDRLGQRFGRLLVTKNLGSRGRLGSNWLCQCDCGTITEITGSRLRNGTLSCGCLRVEFGKRSIHGAARRNSETPEFKTWSRMKFRCSNPKAKGYENYGGRGIMVCDRWLHGEDGVSAFSCFLMDVGSKTSPRHMIEREDVNGNYEPSNVKWALSQEQNRNRRDNRVIEHGGLRKTMAEWCEILGLKYSLIHDRIVRYGWSSERAFRTPPRSSRARASA